MAGFRLTLKKLAKKYGVDIEGATYTKVVQEIINENVARASKKMGSLSNRRMKQAFADSIKDGVVDLPAYAISNLTVRKGAEDGKMITDTLRDVLTRGLRKAITDNPNNTEKAIAQMQSHIKDTFTTYTTSHAKMIAVTEVRSSVDLSKAEYVRELVARNPNKLRVTKKWVHHDHLVKVPRPTHKAIDGEKVLFNQPFSIGLMYPHDPNAPASEVIGCQCGYQVEVEEMATNEIYKELKANINRFGEIRVYKASASINPATGKPYQIGETKVRPDGTKWVKTGTYSWAKAGTKDAEEAKKKTDTDGDGKAEKKEIEGQSSKDAEDILSVYGEKGLYQLTKAGMYNLLLAHGVDDPKSLKWAEKVEKVKEITKEIQERGGTTTTIKTQGKEEFTEEDYHILHNSDLVGNASSLDNTTIHTRNGDVTLKFTKDGGLSDETYDELMQKVDPIEGGHWGSADTHHDTAMAVALVNAPDWKPIDHMQNGMLAKYDQQLSDTMYEHCLVKGIGLRKYAQEKLKHPDMSRENIPNFYRGMTVDASQYEQILAGEVDTIELTGCTAITSFEAVADQYASSQWTKGFGADRRSIKLVIERDDYMDNSIGMFHHNTKGYANGNKNIAFELLTGSPSFYIKSVQKGEDFDIDKSADSYINDTVRYNRNAKDRYDKVKDIDLAQIYDPNNCYFKYVIKDDNGSDIIIASSYYSAVDDVIELKAQSEAQDLNNKIEAWEKQFYKDNIQDFFSKIKNNNIIHKNNDKIRREWEDKVEEAWKKSDLYKQYSNIKDTAPKLYPIDRSSLSSSSLPDEAERKEIDQTLSDPKLLNYYKSEALIDPIEDIGYTWRSLLTEQYDSWREAQNSKKGTLTMKMFLDKRKPLEKSYKTQVDKTEKEYEDFDNFHKWRDQVLRELPQAQERIASEIQQKYGLTDAEMDSIVDRRSDGSIRSFYVYGANDLQRLSSEKRQKLKDYLDKVHNSEPRFTRYGIIYSQGNRFDLADNPYISDELKKSPYFTKSDEYPTDRYEQLVNMRQNYKYAKRENELIAKYDIYNIPNTTFTKMYDDASNTLEEIRNKQKDCLVDKYNELSSSHLNQSVLDTLKEAYKKGSLATPIREQIEKIRDKLVDDKEYSTLTQELTKAEEKYEELSEVSNIYRDYTSKLASMHKSSRPLEVHVVCGRGKKSMTAGADDQLEEQDDGDNQ